MFCNCEHILKYQVLKNQSGFKYGSRKRASKFGRRITVVAGDLP